MNQHFICDMLTGLGTGTDDVWYAYSWIHPGLVLGPKSEAERDPERSCRINTQGSQLALEIRNT